MIYLYGSGAWSGNRKILKIGYTSDLELRKEQYKLHNPLGEFLNTREGDLKLELKLHLRLYDHKVEFLDEWFYDEEEVFKVFESDIEEIDKWLWENKAECLICPVIPLPGTLKREILDELRQKFSNSNNIEGTKFL